MKVITILSRLFICYCLINAMYTRKLKTTQSRCPLGQDQYSLKQHKLQYTDCEAMKFPGTNGGNITFRAKGNDWYIRVANSVADLKEGRFRYWIVFAGWWNAGNRTGMTRVYGPSNNEIAQCTKPQSIDREAHNYDVNFDIAVGQIAVKIDGNTLFSCNPPNMQADFNQAQYYGFSCFCQSPSDDDVVLYNLAQKAPISEQLKIKAQEAINKPNIKCANKDPKTL